MGYSKRDWKLIEKRVVVKKRKRLHESEEDRKTEGFVGAKNHMKLYELLSFKHNITKVKLQEKKNKKVKL